MESIMKDIVSVRFGRLVSFCGNLWWCVLLCAVDKVPF
jgi:hypothetical protein